MAEQIRGNVLILAHRKQILVEYQSYLHSLLGEYLHFNTLPLEQVHDVSQFKGYQCILFATQQAKEGFSIQLDEDVILLACDRTFNHMYLNKIIQLPPHERVYLVNDEEESTLSIITQLRECGITQYEFVPFYPGCEDTEPDIQFALTAGEPQLVPKRIRNVLDIGNRIIDISTILELCECFNIPRQAVNQVTRGYVNQILRIVKTTDTYYTNYVQTLQLMQSIISSLPYGICLFNTESRIQFMNTHFAQALGLPSTNYQGQMFCECLPSAYAETAFDHNGDWIILSSDGKTALNLSVLSLVFPDTPPVFLAFFQESNDALSSEQAEDETTFFSMQQSFSFSLSDSLAVQDMLAQAKHLALYDFPVLICGESGTQRRTLARAVHSYSRRHHYPLHVLHSPGTGLTEESLQQILKDTNHGTLVLSQVDRFPLEIQDLLVNVLMNVHGNFFSAPEMNRFDVRIIAIADENLYEKVKTGTFLPELFYLLTASEIHTVPIRKRREDITLLLDYFLLQFFHDPDMTCEQIFSESLLDFLKTYSYPGNIHELYNLVCSLFTKYHAHQLVLSDLPPYILNQYQKRERLLTDLQSSVLSYLSIHPKTGRSTMQKDLSADGIAVTDAALRSVLKELASEGYLLVNRTRGGCELTELGRMVLQTF